MKDSKTLSLVILSNTRVRIRDMFGKGGWGQTRSLECRNEEFGFHSWAIGIVEALENKAVFQEKQCRRSSQGRCTGKETHVAETSYPTIRVVREW